MDGSTALFCMITTTVGLGESGPLVQALLSQRLAACVQVLPIRSHYVWQGVLRDDAEDLLLIKARREDYPQIEAAIRAAHSYDTPEILCFDVAAGDAAYLGWIEAMTARRGPVGN